jgi:leucyl aminopeptidase (aminopeptidase T)
VQEIEGDDAFRERLWKLKNARNIAEFGIGMNPKATIKGATIIDEKVKGTCHIAFGSSFAIRGKVKAAVHWDSIIIMPTIFFDDEKIMDNGELL